MRERGCICQCHVLGNRGWTVDVDVTEGEKGLSIGEDERATTATVDESESGTVTRQAANSAARKQKATTAGQVTLASASLETVFIVANRAIQSNSVTHFTPSWDLVGVEGEKKRVKGRASPSRLDQRASSMGAAEKTIH